MWIGCWQQDEEFKQRYWSAQDHHSVVDCEPRRDRTANSFLKQLLNQVTEERNAAQRMVNILSKAYSKLAAEKTAGQTSADKV